jgi:hypothetical protein
LLHFVRNGILSNVNLFKPFTIDGRAGGGRGMKKGLEFRFVANKVYSIPGRGMVVTGKVERGSVSVGDEIGFIGSDGQLSRAGVSAIEVSRRLVEEAQAGQEASLLLEGSRKGQIVQGTVLMEVPETAPATAPVSTAATETGPSEPVPPSYPSPAPEPIAPSSGVGRFIIYILVGLLILFAFLYLQGKLDPENWDPRKWDPKKKRTSIQPLVVSDRLSYFVPLSVSGGEGFCASSLRSERIDGAPRSLRVEDC